MPEPRDIAGRHRGAVLSFLTIVIAVVAIDLVVKVVAFERVADAPINVAEISSDQLIPPHDAVPLVPRVLSLKLTLNRGAAFGLGQGGRWLFIVVAVAAAVFIGLVFWRSSPRAKFMHIALALLLAGAAGNLYDRIRFGMVRDMLWLFPDVRLPFGWTWPGGSDQLYPWIFNVADAGMCVALLMLLIVMYRGDKSD